VPQTGKVYHNRIKSVKREIRKIHGNQFSNERRLPLFAGLFEQRMPNVFAPYSPLPDDTGSYPVSSASIVINPRISDTSDMDTGQIIQITSRLALGTLAAFFSIMLWAKTRDVAWMLMIIGVIAVYVQTVYEILGVFGISSAYIFAIDSVSLISIVLVNLPMVFFIAAFAVMVVRKSRSVS